MAGCRAAAAAQENLLQRNIAEEKLQHRTVVEMQRLAVLNCTPGLMYMVLPPGHPHRLVDTMFVMMKQRNQ